MPLDDSDDGEGEDPVAEGLEPDGSFDEGIPMVPPPRVKADLEAFLEQDDSDLGQVYRLDREGKTPEQIAEELDVEDSGSINIHQGIIGALLDGRLSRALTVARDTASKFGSILQNWELSDDARQVLSHNQRILEDRVSEAERESEEGTQEEATPMVPPPPVRIELEAIFRQDTSRFGDVYRLYEQGWSTKEIGKQYSSASVYVQMIKAFLNGSLPTAPTIATDTAGKFRRVPKKNPDLSDDAQRVLSHNLPILEDRASNKTAREQENTTAKRSTSEAEASGKPGIYVYTLPHYYWYPYDPYSGRTLFKVGRSDRDAIKRFREQKRTTALPEDPRLHRLYEVEDSECSESIEKCFHRLLEAAGHDRSTARMGGTEWFVTSLEFLDEIAATLKLRIIVVNDPEEDLDDE